MATITKGYTFGATEIVEAQDLHDLVGYATVSSIVNADISSGAAIAESKIDFDGSSVVTLTGTQTISGDKTFTGLVNFSGASVVGIATGSSNSVTAAFTDGSLVSGIYSFAHNLGSKYIAVNVYNQSQQVVTPDNLTAVDTNTMNIDLNSFTPLISIWNVRGIG